MDLDQRALLYDTCVQKIMPKVSSSAWKVMSFIIGQTCDRWWAQLSYSDFRQGTGIGSNTTIHGSLEELLLWTYIRRRPTGAQRRAYCPNWHMLGFFARLDRHLFRSDDDWDVDEEELEQELFEINLRIAMNEDAKRAYPFGHREALMLWDYDTWTPKEDLTDMDGQLLMWEYALDIQAQEFGYQDDAVFLEALEQFVNLERQISNLKELKRVLLSPQ
jgi:hypothetical protein